MDDLPLLSFAQHLEPVVSYIGNDVGEADRVEIEVAAIANLARLPVAWRVLTPPAPGGVVLRIALVEGAQAAERLIQPDAMSRLQEEVFEGERLAVCVPRRGLLVATSMASALSEPFTRMAERFYDEAKEGEALSPRLFLVDHGAIVAAVIP